MKILEAFYNATVVFDIASGEPRMIMSDVPNLWDASFNPAGCVQVRIPVEVYNASIKNPAGVHIDAVNYARREFLKAFPVTAMRL